jgi:hypothetical protein
MMPSAKEFEKYLESLSEEDYDKLIQERMKRLNPEQGAIMVARELQRKARFKLIEKLKDPDPDVHEMVFNALRDMDDHQCEHGRHWVKHCSACGEIDHVMFPELFNEDGFRIEDDE